MERFGSAIFPATESFDSSRERTARARTIRVFFSRPKVGSYGFTTPLSRACIGMRCHDSRVIQRFPRVLRPDHPHNMAMLINVAVVIWSPWLEPAWPIRDRK